MNLLIYYANNDAEVPKITSELFVFLSFLYSVENHKLWNMLWNWVLYKKKAFIVHVNVVSEWVKILP